MSNRQSYPSLKSVDLGPYYTRLRKTRDLEAAGLDKLEVMSAIATEIADSPSLTGELRDWVTKWSDNEREAVTWMRHLLLLMDPSWQPLTIGDVIRQEPVDMIVEGWVPEKSFAVLYGPSGVGKSFVGLDLAMSMAFDRRWHGHVSVSSGRVVYCAAEGAPGFQKRVPASLPGGSRLMRLATAEGC